VPLYDSLGESAVEYTVNHSETSLIFAEASKLTFLAKAAKNISKNVHTVVYWGAAGGVKDTAAAIEKNVRAHCAGRLRFWSCLPFYA
jgi:long-chain acyl-CoA synthetase